jgi:hypothetical protein
MISPGSRVKNNKEKMRHTRFKIWTLELCAAASPNVSRALFSAVCGLILLLGFSVSSAQVKEEPKCVNCPPTPAPTIKPAPSPSRTTVTPPTRTTPVPMVRATPRPPTVHSRQSKRVYNEGVAPAEKSLATDTKVSIALCVSEGSVKINGWDRDEIRVFVDEGTEVGFLIRSKNRQSGKPNLIEILGYDPQKNKEPNLDKCLSGDTIEIDVPRNTTITNLQGTEADIAIDSINKVAKVKNIGGNISLNNIAQGIVAETSEGDVMVERSSGTMRLSNTNGNIIVFETDTNDVGDIFSARTNSGAITLQQIAHRQIETKSISGSIRYNGEFVSGGQYTFDTTNGSINLSIPVESSCTVNASYGGVFQSDIPLKDAVTTDTGRVKNLTGRLGTGDANMTLVTLSGAIRIRKK